jgi:hypothetical protein
VRTAFCRFNCAGRRIQSRREQTRHGDATAMSETTWVIVVLLLVAALVVGAYMLGRASALAEARRGPAPEPEAMHERGARPMEQAAPSGPGRSAAPPPVLAGGDRAPASAGSAATPPRRAPPPPAAAAGPSAAAAAPHGNAPQRTAKPPPAQAAWSTPKPDGRK